MIFSGIVLGFILLLTTSILWVHRSTPLLTLISQPTSPSPSSIQTPPPINPCDHFFNFICAESRRKKDPTGGVLSDVDAERAALDIYEQVIQTKPKADSDEIDEAVSTEIYTPERTQRIRSIFKTVTNEIIEFIRKQTESVFNDREKNQIIHQIKKLKLEIPPPASVYEDEPDLLTKSDVYYERTESGNTRLRIGGAFLLHHRSWFNLVFTFAHEIGHAIDPCEIRALQFAFPSYDRLASCFIQKKWAKLRKTRIECMQNDQLSEVFADWLATQIVVAALKHFATEFDSRQTLRALRNSVVDLCESTLQESLQDFPFHPSAKIRIEKIFGEHPTIREALGCGSSIAPMEYCELK